MPNFDMTGPRGKGQKTGRGLGKCNELVKNTLVGGGSLMVGSTAIGKIAGTSSDPMVGKIASTGQSAMRIGSIAMPIGAAKGVMNSMDSLISSTKPRRKKNG